MADSVSAVTQFDGDKKLITTYTNISDNSGGTTTIVDVSGLNTNPAGASCSRVRLNKIWYNISVTAPVDAVRLYWDADTDVQFLTLNYQGHMDFSSIGGIKNTPVIKNGEIVPGNIMKVTLSCDHRIVDGATGSAFLNTVKELIEDPIKILV